MPRRRPPAWRNARAAIAAVLLITIWYYLRTPSPGSSRHESALLPSRRQEISAAFDHAWTGYSTHCMGYDTLHPVSNTCDDDFGGWGATAIDALSTAIIMGKRDVVRDILVFVENLDFKSIAGGQKINLFEVTIRHLGGLLSAWDLLNGPFRSLAPERKLMQSLYAKMVVLGDVLSCGFDTPSGIPRNWVDPIACASDDAVSNTLAGAGSLILEFERLSDITGNEKYARLARGAEEFLVKPWPALGEPYPGLLGSFVSVADGRFLDGKGSWGSLSDSFYEYLLKSYIYNPQLYTLHLSRWEAAADSTIQHIARHAYGHPEWTFLPFWDGETKTNAMDALSWFAGGNFILGGIITNNQTLTDFGLSIADTGGAMYDMTATGLGGEFVWWTETCSADWGEDPCTAANSVRLSTMEFNLRPEVLETWYYAHRATGDQKYRDWGWRAFKAIEKFCKTKSGFSAISDVTKVDGGRKLDKQESFVFAEVLKYLFLLHLDEKTPYHIQDSRAGARNTWVFNTEGHLLKVAGEPV